MEKVWSWVEGFEVELVRQVGEEEDDILKKKKTSSWYHVKKTKRRERKGKKKQTQNESYSFSNYNNYVIGIYKTRK